MMRVEKLGKRFGARWIFRNLSFSVGIGERLIIRGHNGSGKSTLVRVLAGLHPPTEGAVYFEGDGRIVLGLSSLETSLYANLTVREHLQFAADLRGCAARVDELVGMIALEEFADYPSSQLSSGMKARVKLAMAVQAQPKILILDEPGASLDEAGRQLVERIADEQSTRGVLIIASNDEREWRLGTHELVLAA